MNDKDSMNTIYYNDTVQLQPCVATIGFFDGVHRGHQFLIHHLVETARKDGLQSTVITFDAHPRKVLQADYQPEMLSTLDSKLLLLSKTEVDNAVVLHFDKAMAAMSARERMVAGTFWISVVARMKMTCAGGSSSVFSRALKAAVDSMCTSSMMYTL